MLDGLAESVPWVPVPVSAIKAGDPGALLVIETLPVTAPEAVGVNFAVKVVFAPALIVAGTVKPLMLKPLPVAVAAVIVRAASPVLVKVIV